MGAVLALWALDVLYVFSGGAAAFSASARIDHSGGLRCPSILKTLRQNLQTLLETHSNQIILLTDYTTYVL